MTERLPVFPDIPVSSIKKSQFRNVDDSEISSEEDLERFLELLEREPHVDVYLFSRRDHGMNTFVLGAIQLGIVRSGPTEMNWYPHPNFHDDFVRIGRDPHWDWEREMLETAPMFMRTRVSLSDRERRRRELLEIAELEQNAVLFLRHVYEVSVTTPGKPVAISDASNALNWNYGSTREIARHLKRSLLIDITDDSIVTLTQTGFYKVTSASKPAELLTLKPGWSGFNIDLKVLWRKLRGGGLKAFWRSRKGG
jgi:hypothetical protein